MERYPIKGQLPTKDEKVILEGTFRGKYRVLAAFMICCGLLLAAFAVSAVWLQKGGNTWLEGLGSFWKGDGGQPPVHGEDGTGDVTDPATDADTTTGEPMQDIVIPDGATPIVSMDLTAPSLGDAYIHNETPYKPNVDALLSVDVSSPVTAEPLVLILHTHTSEAYLPMGTAYIEGAVGDAVYSRNEEQNILAVGKVLSETLKQKGITAIHCTVMHDDPTLSGSYSRAEKTIESYLQAYPSIEYVIDLHRDAVTTSKGEFVRAVTEMNGEAVAQVMAVIGTDCNGTRHENWQDNLALALQLRALLNQNGANLCRPVSLRNASYNQEMASRSLILEIGTGANSVEEAKRAAVLVGEALASLIQPR